MKNIIKMTALLLAVLLFVTLLPTEHIATIDETSPIALSETPVSLDDPEIQVENAGGQDLFSAEVPAEDDLDGLMTLETSPEDLTSPTEDEDVTSPTTEDLSDGSGEEEGMLFALDAPADKTFTMDEAEDFFALSRLYNKTYNTSANPRAPAELADLQRFDKSMTDISSLDPGDLGIWANAVYEGIMSSESTFIIPQGIGAIQLAEFPGIGTAASPFIGQFDGGGNKIVFSRTKTIPTTEAVGVPVAMFPYAKGAVFCDIEISNAIVITNSKATNTINVGGLVGKGIGDASDTLRFDGVTVTGNIVVNTTVANATVAIGGLVAAIEGGNLGYTDCDTALKCTHPSTAANYKSIVEGRYTSTILQPSASELARKVYVQDMAGISVKVFGPGVERESDGTYSVTSGSKVHIVAINESAEFNKWYSTGGVSVTASTSYTTFTMPASGVVLGCQIKPIGTAGLPKGKTFASAYEISRGSDLVALQEVLAETASVDQLKVFDPTVTSTDSREAVNTAVKSAYIKLANDIVVPAGYTGAGTATTSADAFGGFFDGSGVDTEGNAIKHKISFSQGTISGDYFGLFGYIAPTSGYSLVRNVHLDGEFVVTGATTENYFGGIAGYSKSTIFSNVDAGVKLMSTKATNNIIMGGLAGYALNVYAEDCAFLGQTMLKGEIDPELTTNITSTVGGAFGDFMYSIADNVTVNLTNKTEFVNRPAEYNPCYIEAWGFNAYAGGFAGRLLNAGNGSVLPAIVKNSTVTRLDSDDKAGKYVSAFAKGAEDTVANAVAGGMFGIVGVSAAGCVIKNNTIDLDNEVAYNITAGDTHTNATDICNAYAGGYAGLFSNAITASSTPGAPTTANITFKAKDNNVFDTAITIKASVYGTSKDSTTAPGVSSGTIVAAGGFSGYNSCNLDGEQGNPMVFDLTGFSILAEQINKTRNEKVSTMFAGGIVGKASLVFNYVKVTGDKAGIEARRQVDSATYGHIYVGGVSGYTALSINNAQVSLTDSRIYLNQLSYVSRYGNGSVGGVTGHVAGGTISNSTVTASGTTAIYGETGTTCGAHGNSDVYGGGIAGRGDSNAKFDNCTFKGDFTNYSDVKTITVVANQSSNSPSIGGIVGYFTGGYIKNTTVDNVYIYGESYNDAPAATDTDIIVGGIAGLFNGTSSNGMAGLICSSTVKNSKIESQGREYTLTYVGGVLGAAYGATNNIITDCVTYNCIFDSQAQRKWAACGGMMGYAYDGSAVTIFNSAAINCIMNITSTGLRTTTTGSNGTAYTFDALACAGGIVGKVSAGGAPIVLANCYSNTEMRIVNPTSDYTFRGGMIGYAMKGGSKTNTIYNSFFDPNKAGSTLAVDLAQPDTSVTPNPIDGKQYNSGTSYTFGTANGYIAETLTYSDLDLSLTNLTGGVGKNIFLGLIPAGVTPVTAMSSTTITSRATVSVSVRNEAGEDTTSVALTENTGTTKGYIATPAPLPAENLVFADMYITINGVTYPITGTETENPPNTFVRKPLYLGDLPLTKKVELYRNSVVEENKVNSNLEEIQLSDGGAEYVLIADVIYEDGSFAYDFVNWEFCLTADMDAVGAKKLTAAELSSFATVTMQGNQCIINPNVAINDQKVFYVRAKSVSGTSAISGSQNTSYVMKVTITPKYVTGVYIDQAPGNNTSAKPMQFAENATKKYSGTVSPADASLKTYEFVGYKVVFDAYGNPVESTTTLRGVKLDGTIFGSLLVGATPAGDGLKVGDTIVVYAISYGMAKNSSSLEPGCSLLSAANRRVKSKPFYITISDSLMVVPNIEGGSYYAATNNAIPGEVFTFETTNNGTMLVEPSVAYYTDPTTGKMHNFPLKSDDVPEKEGMSYSFDGGKSTYTFMIPKDATTNIYVTIRYFKKITAHYIDPISENTLTTGEISEFVREEYILDEEDIENKIGEVALFDCYTIAGWYNNRVIEKDVTLNNYKNELVPTEIIGTDESGNPEYSHQLEITGDSYNLYARYQYRVSVTDTAALNTSTCANVAEGEKPDHKMSPINHVSDYVLQIDKPASYQGAPRVGIYVGGKLLTQGIEYTQNEEKVTIESKYLTTAQLIDASGAGDHGIRIETYHNNLEFAPIESSTADSDKQTPEDGVFTFIYNINHARRMSPQNSTIDKATYGYTPTTSGNSNDIGMSFTNPLPKGTVIEVHHLLDGNPIGLYWNQTAGGETSLYLKDFKNLGTYQSVLPQAFNSYLPKSGQTNSVTSLEQYFVVVTPPSYDEADSALLLPGDTRVTMGYYGVDGSNQPMSLTMEGNDAVEPLAASRSVVPKELQSPGMSVSGNTASGTVTVDPSTAPEKYNYRHMEQDFAVGFYFVYNNEVVLLPDGAKITFNGETYTSTLSEPLNRVYFDLISVNTAKGTPVSKPYSITGIDGIPSGAELVVQLVEYPAAAITKDGAPAELESGDLWNKAAGGIVRMTKIVS